MKSLYLDLDGLGADWRGYVLKKLPQFTDIQELNKSPQRSEILTQLYENDPRLFYNLEPIAKYQLLVDYAKANFEDWHVLTAGAEEHGRHKVVKQDKRYWCAEMFEIPYSRCCVVHNGSDKIRYAEGNILVDDYIKNCEMWEAAGGHAIHAPTDIYCPDKVIEKIESLRLV